VVLPWALDKKKTNTRQFSCPPSWFASKNHILRCVRINNKQAKNGRNFTHYLKNNTYTYWKKISYLAFTKKVN
jgi:hypothetical protein